MSFLDTLVARNLGEAASIRPQPSSLFESSRGNADRRLLEEDSGAAVTEAALSTVEPMQRNRAPGTRPKSAPPTACQIENFADVEVSAEKSRQNDTRQEARPDGQEADSAPALNTNSILAVPRTPSEPTHSAGTGKSRGMMAVEPEGEEMFLNAQPTSGNISLPIRSSQRVESGMLADRQRAAPLRGQETDAGFLGALPRLRGDRRDSVSTSRRRLVQHGDAASGPTNSEPVISEPAIEVTIGRIEIRAETGTSAQKTKPTASPVMGLEEYLRHRSNRGNA